MADNRSETLSGLTADEAQAFHKYFMQGFIIFTVVAVVAHILAWMWRPWLPSVDGYASYMDGVNSALTSVQSFLA
ncbi:MAG: light-harvesting antenna LH1, beta subunit [Limibacillus sp.]|jgi:light-harvesting complex 1 beta chain